MTRHSRSKLRLCTRYSKRSSGVFEARTKVNNRFFLKRCKVNGFIGVKGKNSSKKCTKIEFKCIFIRQNTVRIYRDKKGLAS
jgi:hypothetical protein